MDAQLEAVHLKKAAKISKKSMDSDYIAYIRECNTMIKKTGDIRFKAMPEHIWVNRLVLIG